MDKTYSIQITETQYEALRQIVLDYDDVSRVPETPAEQIVFPVESSSVDQTPPWVVGMWNQMLDRIPRHRNAVRMHDGTPEACWAVKLTATDITHWQGITNKAEEINAAKLLYRHPRISMTKIDNKSVVKVYDRDQWAR